MIFLSPEFIPSNPADSHKVNQASFDYSPFVSAVNISAIRKHASFLSSLGTRATGYSSNIRAAEYIFEKFSDFGLENVSYQDFPVTDCLSYGANITVLETGETVTLHPILPNFIVPSATPPGGMTGRLIYAGTGTIEEFDGKEVKGSIVLLDWNSEANWLNAARLGAKAVIFLPPKPEEIVYSLYAATSFSSRSPGPVTKCLWDTPLNFPRFYVEEAGAGILRSSTGKSVHLVSTHRWTKITGRNVVGFIKGWERPEGIIVLSSYYDSYSEAPTVAPGAQEALGVSTLLELAKLLAKPENQPPLTIMFVAFGGHHQALEGARSFVNEYFFPAENLTRRKIGTHIWRLYNFDFSTGTSLTFMTEDGNSHQGASGGKAFYLRSHGEPAYEDLLYDYLDELNKQTGKEYVAYLKLGYLDTIDRWSITQSAAANVMSTKIFAYDHEPFKILPMPPYVYTFTTLYDRRPYFRTPFDTIEKIKWQNLQIQLECTYALLLRSLNQWKKSPSYQPVKQQVPGFERMDEFYYPWYGRTEMRVACGVIYGKVAVWKEERAFWKVLNKSDLGTLPNPLIFFKGTRPLDRRFIFAEDDGKFAVTGILHAYYNPVYEISAWVVDPVTGNVVLAPDQGPHKYPTGALPIVINTQWQDIGYLTVFNASTLAILDLIYPSNLGLIQNPVTGALITPSIIIHKSKGLVPPVSYGVWIEGTVCVLASPSGEPMEVSVKALGDRYPFIVLTNGSEDRPLGKGFSLGENEQKIVTFPILQYAKDFYYLNKDRMEVLNRYMAIAKSANYKDYLRSEEDIREAVNALGEGNFSRAYALAINAFLKGRNIYINTRQSIEDIASVVPFFSFLILPFTFLLEKLITDQKGFRKALSLVGIFAVTLFALYIVHPGFAIAANPISIVIGFSVLILSAPILLIIYSEGWGLLREMRIKRVGVHEIEVGRTEQAIYSFNVGVENMKKRRFRTTLTIISIIIVVSSIISFISISSERSVRNVEFRAGEPLYEGILIRKIKWGQGHADTGQTVLNYLKGRYGQQSLMIPRAWKYTLWPDDVSAIREDIGFVVSRGGKHIYPKVLYGITPDEDSVTYVSYYLEEGGLPFVRGSPRVCYVSGWQAEQLGINATDLPAEISVENIPFQVVGIISKEKIFDLRRILSLDGESITPVKRDYPPDELNPWNEHLPQDEILIMPYEDVMLLGGEIASISVKPYNPLDTRTMADEIHEATPSFEVYSNLKKGILRHGGRVDIIFGGFETQIVPLIIVGLTIFNILLGSVHERRRHISIYSSIGLSPLHVATLFLAETLVYGVIGGVIGYLVAMVQLKMYEAIIGVVIANYFSNMVVIAISMGILATILSALYPAYLSARLVTPSLERAWKIPTSPIGDLWNIPLPFFAASETEARSILAYLHEFLIQHQIPDAPVFMVSNLRMEEGTLENYPAPKVVVDSRLAPYHVGVTQETEIIAVGVKPDRWEFSLMMRRTGGAIDEWVRLSRGAINLLREQLLLWRTLPEEEKRKYRGDKDL